MEAKRFAVYGTLRPGFGNNRLLQRAKHLGTERTKPQFKMYNVGWFPAVIEGNEEITVDVYEVTEPEIVKNLDRLEGAYRNNPSQGMYRAETVETSHGEADIYIWNDDVKDLDHISSGDFTRL